MEYLESEYKGHRITILKNRITGGWQGYAGIPKHHPLYELNYDSSCPIEKSKVILEAEISNSENFMENKGVFPTFMAMMEGSYTNSVAMYFNVHGGITFSDYNYWSPKRKEDIVITKDVKNYIKISRLRNLTGNDLFTHYHEKGIRVHNHHYLKEEEKRKREENPLFNNALKVHSVYEYCTQYLREFKPVIKNNNGDEFVNWIIDKEYNIKVSNDDYWYFGWDSAHYEDEPDEFTKEKALEETRKLVDQLIEFTFEYYK